MAVKQLEHRLSGWTRPRRLHEHDIERYVATGTRLQRQHLQAMRRKGRGDRMFGQPRECEPRLNNRERSLEAADSPARLRAQKALIARRALARIAQHHLLLLLEVMRSEAATERVQ